MRVASTVWAVATVAVVSAPGVAHAQRVALDPPSPEPSAALPPPGSDDGGTSDPVLPPDWEVKEPTYWVFGVTLENAGQNINDGEERIRDTLFGLSAAFRYDWVGPHARLLVAPDGQEYQNSRFFGGLGFRAHLLEALGTEFSYGVGAHFDARLKRHYWLAGVTPFELGAKIWSKGSWHIELFTGARFAFAGELVDWFLIDPNGFNNENAADDLRAARDDQPWEGFLAVVFGRRID